MDLQRVRIISAIGFFNVMVTCPVDAARPPVLPEMIPDPGRVPALQTVSRIREVLP